MSQVKGFVSPAMKVRKMRDILERGEFADQAKRWKLNSLRVQRGLSSAKLIEKRLRAISAQLSGRKN